MTTTSSVWCLSPGPVPQWVVCWSVEDLSGSDLGAIAHPRGAGEGGLVLQLVQYVIMGQVLTAGAGQIPVGWSRRR